MPRTKPREIPSLVYDPSCVLYLPLWRRDGTTITSEDAYGRSCAVTGTTWGMQGRTCDGSGDKITLANLLGIPTGAVDTTVMAWLKPDTVSGTRRLYEMGNYGLEINGTSLYWFSNNVARASATISANVWICIQASQSVSDAINILDINGGMTRVTNAYGATLGAASGGIIGDFASGGRVISGIIGEVAQWNRALTLTEKYKNYEQTKWRFV